QLPVCDQGASPVAGRPPGNAGTRRAAGAGEAEQPAMVVAAHLRPPGLGAPPTPECFTTPSGNALRGPGSFLVFISDPQRVKAEAKNVSVTKTRSRALTREAQPGSTRTQPAVATIKPFTMHSVRVPRPQFPLRLELAIVLALFVLVNLISAVSQVQIG